MNKTVFILDDEPDILETVSLHLEKAGYRVCAFDNVNEFWRGIAGELPALILLDLMLPDADGMDICRELRKNEKTAGIPVIMLTAKDEEMDKVLGLELGADDYITKPYSRHEFLARIKAVLRRTSPKPQSGPVSIAKDLRVDYNTYEVWAADQRVDLTSTEFKLLKMLVERPGWVFNREQILDYLWGKDKIVIDRTVDVHIKNIREKLGDAGNHIKNIRGVGYKFEV